jgi:hypothetical protein
VDVDETLIVLQSIIREKQGKRKEKNRSVKLQRTSLVHPSEEILDAVVRSPKLGALKL